MARGKTVLDTSLLIWSWHLSRNRPLAEVEADDVDEWARRLIDLYHADAIVAPVVIEFVSGTTSGHELHLARAYLFRFRSIDGGIVLAEDWIEARRIAERIPRDGRPRQLGDCLIRAIARRLHHDVLTREERFPPG